MYLPTSYNGTIKDGYELSEYVEAWRLLGVRLVV